MPTLRSARPCPRLPAPLRALLGLAPFVLCVLILSAAASAQAPNPVPTISSLSPSGVVADGPDVKLTVSGTGFVRDSRVIWNNQFLPTTLVTDPSSPPHLVATVSGLLMLNIGTFHVSVTSPTPGGGTSSTLDFVVTAPVPAISGLSPVGVVAGGAAMVLTVYGDGLVSSSIVEWNGQPLPTTFINSPNPQTRLDSYLSSAQVASVGTAAITVVNPAPDGGTSKARTFSVVAASPTPVLTALSPAHVTEGGPDIALTVTGTGFDATSLVLISVYPYSQQGLPATLVSPTQITTVIPASVIAQIQTIQVHVVNGFAGISSVPSNILGLTVDPAPYPVPTITALSPTSVPAGTGAFTLHITGTGFNKDTQVKFGAHFIYTHLGGGTSDTGIDMSVPASEVPAAAGTALVTVINPTSGPGFGGTSNAVPFLFTAPPNPAPITGSLSPAQVTQGGPAFTLSVLGARFLPSSQVQWNGSSLATTFVSAAQLTALVPAALLTTLDWKIVTVSTPAPGGGVSSGLLLTVQGAGHTHLLWNDMEGRVMLWSIDGYGSFTVSGFGPYTDGAPQNLWHATAVATGPDGKSHLLWNNTDGRVMLWTVDDTGYFTLAGYGPYTDNAPQNKWSAVGVSVGPDNVVHLLWSNTDRRAMLWNVAPDFTFTLAGYGPYTDDAPQNLWSAMALATGPDNVSRIVWNNTDTRVMLWDVAPDFTFTLAGYGPYTDDAPQNKWSAVGVSVGPDNLTHLLWSNTDRRAMFWDVDSAFGFTLAGYGPYTDNAPQNLWSAAAVATGPDGLSHILWGNTDYRAMLWGVSNAFGFSVAGYGPYTGYAPSNLWSVTAVSAGP